MFHAIPDSEMYTFLVFSNGLRGMDFSQVPNHVMIGVRTNSHFFANLALMADLEGEEGPKRDKLTFLQWQDGDEHSSQLYPFLL